MTPLPGGHRLAVPLALALVAAALPTPAPAQDEARAEACDRGWSEVELREDIAPEGVVAFEASGPWVAGGAMLGGGRREVAVLHGLGEEAKLELPPAPGTRDSGLMAISGTGPEGPLWAVGYGRETDYVVAYATRRQGGDWDLGETIHPKGFNSALTDVAVSEAAGTWAVGFLQGRPGDQRPWVLQRRGGDWLAEDLPLARGERATLAAVSASAEGGVWVAGTALADSAMRPYLAVRGDDGWRRREPDGLEGAAVADIDVPAPDHGWAAGHRLAGHTIEPLLLHWDGRAWSAVDAPAPSAAPTLLTSVDEAGDVLSVGGTTWDPERHRYTAFAARRTDGGEWSLSLARPRWGMGTITDVDGDPGASGWAVGRTDDGLIARLCDAPLDEAELPPPGATGTSSPGTGTTGTGTTAPEPAIPAPRRPLRGDPVAVDVTAQAGLPSASQSWGSTAADFDGDGDTDLFLGRHGARARLFRNDGGRFVDTELTFGGGDRHACAAADVDDSGLPDLYCAFGASRGTGTKHNQLWLDPGGTAPMLEPWAGGATEPLGRGRQPLFLDLDEDGDLDLFLGQETKRMDGLPSTNRAFIRTGPAYFEAVEAPGIDTGLAAEDLDLADYDGDGRSDILFVYWDLRARAPKAGIRLYRNEEGLAFTDVTASAGIRSIGERDAAFADLDGKRGPDLLQLAEDELVVSLARDGRFERVESVAVAEGTALAVGDADGDGDTDVYVLQGKSPGGSADLILLNDGDGASFTRLDVPPVRGGSEDDVIALDYDTDGRTDFLALNGLNSERGPVQLITLRSE